MRFWYSFDQDLVADYVKSSAGVQSRNPTRTRGKILGDFPLSLLPLFPLDVVLFSGTPLPLHIFEPRYREMISECLDRKKSFGVVRAKEEGVVEIGCTAEIITVTKKYPDGRLDIVTGGMHAVVGPYNRLGRITTWFNTGRIPGP